MKANYNVILIGIDTLRADHLGCYGYRRLTSPVIDSFVKDCIFFTNCYSQAPNTAPSFMSILTSLYPSYHGILNIVTAHNGGKAYVLPADISTLPEILRYKGYRTAAFTDGGQLSPRFGFAKGFDYYSINQRSGGYGVGTIPEEEIRYFLEQSRNENFFLFLHSYAVHNPWSVPWQNLNSFTDGYGGNFKITDSFPKKVRWLEDDRVSTYTFFLENLAEKGNDSDLEYYKSIYDGAITYIDAFFSRLLESLSNLDLLRNTVIVFTSDHGEEFKDHGMFDHQQLYNELLHVPLFIYIPGFSHNSVMNQTVRSIDIMPTILDILGLKIGEKYHGESLISATGKSSEILAIAETERDGFAVQNKRFKLINHVRKFLLDELYDLENDPSEKQNIAFDNLDIVEKLRWRFESEVHRFPDLRPRKKIIYLAPHLLA